ncbi:MAG: F0F1 ATP synthase subunit A [Rhodospirillaceae bacterium]|jgi:F-type H+-transporting ATPase subunit a|nr:F0F1 ATP synthase subunit A [Rhodospirillaceae bacterium]
MATEANNPMEQFEIKSIVDINVSGYDISFTNSAAFMFAAVACTFLLFWTATRRRTMVPSRIQSVGELMFEFVAGMVKENVGKEGMKYFPFILTLFCFILFGNVLGLLPLGHSSFTFTSHIIVNATLAIFIFVAVTIIGFARHGLHYLRLFCPEGTPLPVAIVLVPIEIMSYFIRPVSLSLRLFANMLAGHVLLKVLAGFIISLGFFGIVPFIAVSAVTLLEIMVALIQAYVFALLSTIYLNDAVHLH